jgi:hypothetical protein
LLAGIPAQYFDELDDGFCRQFSIIGEVVVFDDSVARIRIEGS